MTIKQKQIGCLLTVGIILVSSMGVSNSACGQEQEESLKWSIKTNKNEFYPGEPVLLTLNIRNMGSQEEKVHFGIAGVDAFTMGIRNSNGVIVSKGNKIQRFGFTTRSPLCTVPPGKIGQKSIVLNQWCSTLLPAGQYHVTCNIEYRLRSESRKKENSNAFKAGPLHKMQLKLNIQIIELNQQKFKEIIKELTSFEVRPEAQNKGKWLAKRDIAREMLTFTESELAVLYQLQLLRIEQCTWRKRDIINSLAMSETLEATQGLVQIIEDTSVYKEDVKSDALYAVYRLRETGNQDIINATNAFVAKYKRPVLSKPID